MGVVSLVLLIILGLAQLMPNGAAALAFSALLHGPYAAVLIGQESTLRPCPEIDAEAMRRLTTGQRLAVGSLLSAAVCADAAAQVLPPLATSTNRPALLAYQWGLIAWQNGDAASAVEIWRQGQDIDRRLLFQARGTPASNLAEAQRWYEAAIMVAGSPQMQAEAITAYTEDLRGRISAEAFRARLAYLAAYFGAETAIGYRLSGQRAQGGGDYGTAVAYLSRAIASGIADAETWYLLGDAAWKLDDLPAAERAYRAALDATIQIPGRRAWHLHRLASLLATGGRFDEALVFQQEAARLSDYYAYSDQLAALYARLGQPARARAACNQARLRAGAVLVKLPCEALSLPVERQ